jgi:hypothetical protein
LKTWIICGGGRNKSTHNFREIRTQLTWGNKYIKFKGKCLAKVNWIKSGIICINDTLDEYGRISEYKIIVKLRNKENWISELNILKKAIPILIIPLFIQLTFAKHLPLNFIYLFPHVNCFPISLKLCVLLFLPPPQIIHVFNNFL